MSTQSDNNLSYKSYYMNYYDSTGSRHYGNLWQDATTAVQCGPNYRVMIQVKFFKRWMPISVLFGHWTTLLRVVRNDSRVLFKKLVRLWNFVVLCSLVKNLFEMRIQSYTYNYPLNLNRLILFLKFNFLIRSTRLYYYDTLGWHVLVNFLGEFEGTKKTFRN